MINFSAFGQTNVKIFDPSIDGIEVGIDYTVRGKAVIPDKNYLWILVHRVDFIDMWYPQNAVYIDPATKEWKVTCYFGNGNDIGWDFEIAAILVDDLTHRQLTEYRIKAMETGNWNPKLMPETIIPPIIKKVKKVRN